MGSLGTWIVKGFSNIYLPSIPLFRVSDDYGDSTHEPSSYTSLGLVNLEEEVSQALLFLNKQMKESSSPFESHL
ncbi:Hypothetical protein FKW44_010754 [Caligus rogercresseyi]|uniref:Uncharacterized protein n=1 Tax=Caligus rogercresseyi TaxID=217165 RepID=A0A7T8HH62_CALRO|nr:Hypothetical protein FKW44_010754 [Caligus rogercresseyi]